MGTDFQLPQRLTLPGDPHRWAGDGLVAAERGRKREREISAIDNSPFELRFSSVVHTDQPTATTPCQPPSNEGPPHCGRSSRP